ncbi:MAG: adenylate/guanylate cyclase domain-containing protein [Phaeodactylibacter sp.]|nr:adenylate/guanylate cyclase domain-containing protein [Phaeodactylibacter sp.]MCB9273870.1 adenylate/guanylate cyclase domain-containing protein [Lewinellaceae bacterium]
MLSPKTKRNISRIIPFGVIWLITGLAFLVVEEAAIKDIGLPSTTRIELNVQILVFSALAVTVVGLLVGAIEILYLDKALSRFSFGKRTLYKLLFYTAMMFVVTLITFPVAASLELHTGLFDKRVWEKLYVYLTSISHLSANLQMSITLGIALFYTEVSDNIGQGVLANFFTGKYHKPLEEERIFMFLDMKSSTTIAEQLGHIRYFELLRAYYADMSEAIVLNSGEIYEYVGDEVIVTWKMEAGVANNNCIRCFFAMRDDLRKRAGWYLKKFGVEPTFKAGMHYGKVTAGEIGVVKKEITFTGDVLNATARIQGLCNSLDTDLLISGELLERLALAAAYSARPLGHNELRGKKEGVDLFTIERTGDPDGSRQ